jgi:hypothetical protein
VAGGVVGGERGSCGSSIPCRPRPALQVLGNGGNGLLAVDLGPASGAGATGGTPAALVERRRPGWAPGWACWVAEGVMGARPDRSGTFGLGVAMPFRAREGEVRRVGGTLTPRALRPATRPRSRAKAPSSTSRVTTTAASKAGSVGMAQGSLRLDGVSPVWASAVSPADVQVGTALAAQHLICAEQPAARPG